MMDRVTNRKCVGRRDASDKGISVAMAARSYSLVQLLTPIWEAHRVPPKTAIGEKQIENGGGRFVCAPTVVKCHLSLCLDVRSCFS